MQIVKKNLKAGEVVLKVDSLDDLWYVSQLVSDGDLVSGKTERKVKLGGDDDRKQTVVKRIVFVAIRAEKVEFHKYSDRLRISGKIVEAPEEIPRGSYHTIEVEPGSTVGITKDAWPGFQLDKLDEAVQDLGQKMLLVIFDREDAIFALMKSQGHEILSRLKGDVARKRFESADKKNFYKDIAEMLMDYDKRLSPKNIILASPSFWKEYLLKELPEELKPKVVLATCSDVEEGAIHEVMHRPEMHKVLESDRAAKESLLIEELLKAISREEACYGIAECREKVDLGAVKLLVVSYDYLNKEREAGRNQPIEAVMKLAEVRGAKVHLISAEEPEKRLSGLGGIAGVLRWKTS